MTGGRTVSALLAAAGACFSCWPGSNPSTHPPTSSAEPRVPAFLTRGDVSEDYPLRALWVAGGPVYFEQGGDAVGENQPPDCPEELVVVSADGPMLRVWERGWGMDLALYVPREALATVALQRTRLLAAVPGDDLADPVAWVELPPGSVLKSANPLAVAAPLESTERVERPAYVPVEYVGPDLQATGYVESGTLGQAYRLDGHAGDPAPKVNAVLLDCTELYATPNGEVFAHLRQEAGRSQVTDLGDHVGNMVLIHFEGYKTNATAWIPASCVQRDPNAVWGVAYSAECSKGGGGPGIAPYCVGKLARGTRAFDRPKGNVVGVVSQETAFRCLSEPRDGWARIGVYTRFGELPVWISVPPG